MFDWMLEPPSLHVRLNVGLPGDPAGLERIARVWLELGTERLAAEEIDRLRNAPALTDKSLTNHRGAFGAPGTPWGSLVIAPEEPRKQASLRAWTPSTWTRFVDGLGSSPRRAGVTFSRLDERGQPGGGTSVYVGVERENLVRGWVTLVAHREPATASPETDAVAQTWLEFLVDAMRALGVPVGFGCLGSGMTTAPTTPFESAQLLFPGAPLEQGRLRGYAWVTVLGSTAADLVGGVDALTGSGSFDTVTRIDGGAVLVQATPHLSGYDDAVAERVLTALAPALPQSGDA